MKQAAKFLFDTSFDVEAAPKEPPHAPAPVEPEPAPEPEPTFSEADLAAARREGYEQGRAEAERAAQAAAEQAAGAALARIAEALPGLAAQIEDGFAATARVFLTTAVASLKRLMPELGRRGGLVEMEALLKETIQHLREEARIAVRLHESQLDDLRNRLDAVAQAAGFGGRIVLLADEEIMPGDCRIEWADGGVERVAERVWSGIEAAVLRSIAVFPSPDRPAGGTQPTPPDSPAP